MSLQLPVRPAWGFLGWTKVLGAVCKAWPDLPAGVPWVSGGSNCGEFNPPGLLGKISQQRRCLLQEALLNPRHTVLSPLSAYPESPSNTGHIQDWDSYIYPKAITSTG